MPTVTPSKKQAEHVALALRLSGCELLAHKVDYDLGGGVAVLHDVEGGRVFKVFAVVSGEVAREAERELAMHKLLTVHARDAVMPLLSVTHDKQCEMRDGLRRLSGELYWWLFDRARDILVLETEFADGGARLNWAALTGADLARYGEQLVSDVAALHAAKVVHGDLKPGNAVLHKGAVRLIDFGMSTQVDLFSARSRRVVAGGTRGFMAPEVEAARDEGREDRTTRLTLAVDVYSTGRVLALAAEGAAAACEPLRRLVARMTATAAADRPTARAALNEWRRKVAPALSV